MVNGTFENIVHESGKVVKIALLLCVVLIVTGCSPGSGAGLDANGRPIGEVPDPDDAPTLANIQARIFTPICTRCHIGAAAPQGLRLDAANSFDDLVGVRSREVSSFFRVLPAAPDNSYLVHKIEGTAAVGEQMPLGGPPLPAEDILLIRQWIADGAEPIATASSGVTKVLNVQSGTPDSGTAHVIRIIFSKDLDASTIHDTSVVVVKSSDDVFGNDDDVQEFNYRVSSSFTNRHALVIRIPITSEGNNWYRINVSPEGSARILDISGQPVEPYVLELH